MLLLRGAQRRKLALNFRACLLGPVSITLLTGLTGSHPGVCRPNWPAPYGIALVLTDCR
jgi:hypothetical protein